MQTPSFKGELRHGPDISLAPAQVDIERRSDGTWILRSPQRLAPYSRCIGDWLEHWAHVTPDAVFLGERGDDGGWQTITYRQALHKVRAIAQGLLERGLDANRPVAALSPNSIAMGLMMLGAMHAGIPFAPISQAYALLSNDGKKLRHVLDLLSPGLLFVSDLKLFEPALQRVGVEPGRLIVAGGNAHSTQATHIDTLCQAVPGALLERAFQGLTPDAVGKILFTSGSTGVPKGVMNTHRMMCSNQQAITQLMPFLSDKPPVMVDWLPWNHTAGCNGAFNMNLRHGGTLYIDDGKPVAGDFDRSLRNLKEIPSTLHTNVPRGYEMLLSHLQSDEAFQELFFRHLDYMCFAGAAMPAHHHQALKTMARRHRGGRIIFSAGYGATETGPAVTVLHFDNDQAANIGLPLPGTDVMLTPSQDKLEIRVRGPGVMPGYWRQDDLTQGAFDAEGYYRIGDAARFLDPARPQAGLLFDGRVVEDFKLSSATWVNVASVRARALAMCAPIAQDVVISGQDQKEIGLLLVLNEAATKAHLGIPATHSYADLAGDERVRAFVHLALQRQAGEATGSASRPQRALILDRPPALDSGELTDKGAVSQRAVLSLRVAEVRDLHATHPPLHVLTVLDQG